MFYVAYPLMTAAFFLAAIVDAWLTVLGTGSLLLATGLALIWIALLLGLLLDATIEGTAFGSGVATAFLSRPIALWFGGMISWSPVLTRVAFVESVMLVLAIANLTIGWRLEFVRGPVPDVRRRGSGERPGRAVS